MPRVAILAEDIMEVQQVPKSNVYADPPAVLRLIVLSSSRMDSLMSSLFIAITILESLLMELIG